jgi:para-nitrobenzyl esterase
MIEISRRFLLQSSLILGLPLGFVRSEERWTTLPAAPFVTVETAQGKVRGGSCRGALAFKGIPYAGSVSGAGRFRPAPPPPTWTGVRDALALGPPCPQKAASTYGQEEPAYDENCLTLNVWTPAVSDGRKRPVMFYCHGGGFVTGSAGSVAQDGSKLAAQHDVVVVASNHRLGLLGYLFLDEAGSANAGMQDIVAALRWVQSNIAAFGGDPGNVTIFGESGGGAKVATLMTMPMAVGLFHKAGVQSGVWPRRLEKSEASEIAARVFKSLEITPNRPDLLASVPLEKLMAVQFAAQGWGPVVDGAILPAHPYDPVTSPLSAAIPLMIGNNRDEATFNNIDRPETFSMDETAFAKRLAEEFGDKAAALSAAYRRAMPKASPSERYIAIATAKAFGNDTAHAADLKSAQAAPVYAYRYDYASNHPIKGTHATLRAGHATDIGSTFGNIDIPGLQGDGPGLAEASRNMGALWSSFARDGVPSADGVPSWPRYQTATRPTMLINSACQVVRDPDASVRAAWG